MHGAKGIIERNYFFAIYQHFFDAVCQAADVLGIPLSAVFPSEVWVETNG